MYKLYVTHARTRTRTHVHTHARIPRACMPTTHYLTRANAYASIAHTREEPVDRFALISRPIKTHVMLKFLPSINQIFRQEKQRKTLTLFCYKMHARHDITYIHTRTRTCTPVYHTRTHACTQRYITHTHAHTCTQTNKHTYVPADTNAHIHTYIHACLRTRA